MSATRTVLAALVVVAALGGCWDAAAPAAPAAPRSTVGKPLAPLDLAYRIERSDAGDDHRLVVVELSAHTTLTRIVVTTDQANAVEVAPPKPGAVLAMNTGQTTRVTCDVRLLGGPKPSFDLIVQFGPAQRQALRIAVTDPPPAAADGATGEGRASGQTGSDNPAAAARGAAPGPAPQVVQMPDGERMVIQHGTSADAR